MLARVQRLTRDGFIQGYEARLDPRKLGRGMMVFVEVLLDRTTPNVFEAFRAAVRMRQRDHGVPHGWPGDSTTC